MSFVSAHVLDAAAGRPAAGVVVELADDAGLAFARGVTDDDGRVNNLGPDHLDAGAYQVVFGSGDYFGKQNIPCFHPSVSVRFTVGSVEQHLHIPLLLSPYAYTTYRGS